MSSTSPVLLRISVVGLVPCAVSRGLRLDSLARRLVFSFRYRVAAFAVELEFTRALEAVTVGTDSQVLCDFVDAIPRPRAVVERERISEPTEGTSAPAHPRPVRRATEQTDVL